MCGVTKRLARLRFGSLYDVQFQLGVILLKKKERNHWMKSRRKQKKTKTDDETTLRHPSSTTYDEPVAPCAGRNISFELTATRIDHLISLVPLPVDSRRRFPRETGTASFWFFFTTDKKNIRCEFCSRLTVFAPESSTVASSALAISARVGSRERVSVHIYTRARVGKAEQGTRDENASGAGETNSPSASEEPTIGRPLQIKKTPSVGS